MMTDDFVVNGTYSKQVHGMSESLGPQHGLRTPLYILLPSYAECFRTLRAQGD